MSIKSYNKLYIAHFCNSLSQISHKVNKHSRSSQVCRYLVFKILTPTGNIFFLNACSFCYKDDIHSKEVIVSPAMWVLYIDNFKY